MKLNMTGILFMILVFPNLNSEKERSCGIIGSLLDYVPAKKIYNFDRNKTLPIIFVDTLNYFGECDISNYNDRQVKIFHDPSVVKEIRPSDYIITVNSINKNTFRITLFYRTNGAHCLFTLKWKRDKFKVIGFLEEYL